ncbi:MAG: hypothetical protein EXS67_05555 [Candidatus Margulisbacteria bacterium]|nr:hypothetical protein [Candidatus Margulisiibacteriota bacterium]
MDIKTIQRTLPATSQLGPQFVTDTMQSMVPFQDILKDAVAQMEIAPAAVQNPLKKIKPIETAAVDGEISDKLMAQAINDPTQSPVIPQANQQSGPIFTAKNINEEGLKTSRLEVTPFQFFIDKGIDLFRNISNMEQRSDQLMEQYARGEISIEEMSIEKAKVSVALSFAVTLVTQVTQAFNELKNMQV